MGSFVNILGVFCFAFHAVYLVTCEKCTLDKPVQLVHLVDANNTFYNSSTTARILSDLRTEFPGSRAALASFANMPANICYHEAIGMTENEEIFSDGSKNIEIETAFESLHSESTAGAAIHGAVSVLEAFSGNYQNVISIDTNWYMTSGDPLSDIISVPAICGLMPADVKDLLTMPEIAFVVITHSQDAYHFWVHALSRISARHFVYFQDTMHSSDNVEWVVRNIKQLFCSHPSSLTTSSSTTALSTSTAASTTSPTTTASTTSSPTTTASTTSSPTTTASTCTSSPTTTCTSSPTTTASTTSSPTTTGSTTSSDDAVVHRAKRQSAKRRRRQRQRWRRSRWFQEKLQRMRMRKSLPPNINPSTRQTPFELALSAASAAITDSPKKGPRFGFGYFA